MKDFFFLHKNHAAGEDPGENLVQTPPFASEETEGQSGDGPGHTCTAAAEELGLQCSAPQLPAYPSRWPPDGHLAAPGPAGGARRAGQHYELFQGSDQGILFTIISTVTALKIL